MRCELTDYLWLERGVVSAPTQEEARQLAARRLGISRDDVQVVLVGWLDILSGKDVHQVLRDRHSFASGSNRWNPAWRQSSPNYTPDDIIPADPMSEYHHQCSCGARYWIRRIEQRVDQPNTICWNSCSTPIITAKGIFSYEVELLESPG